MILKEFGEYFFESCKRSDSDYILMTPAGNFYNFMEKLGTLVTCPCYTRNDIFWELSGFCKNMSFLVNDTLESSRVSGWHHLLETLPAMAPGWDSSPPCLAPSFFLPVFSFLNQSLAHKSSPQSQLLGDQTLDCEETGKEVSWLTKSHGFSKHVYFGHYVKCGGITRVEITSKGNHNSVTYGCSC